MKVWIRRLRQRTEKGASAVEYAILVALIAIIVLVAVAFLGERTNGLFVKTCSSVASTQGGAAC